MINPKKLLKYEHNPGWPWRIWESVKKRDHWDVQDFCVSCQGKGDYNIPRAAFLIDHQYPAMDL